MTDKSKITRIIQALIAKAKSTNSEEEAEAFMAKAMELLKKHQIDMGSLIDGDDPVVHDTGLEMAAGSHKWNRELFRVLGLLYGCESCYCEIAWDWIGSGRNRRYGATRIRQELVGRESAIVTTKLMYPWVAGQVRARAKEIARITGMSEQGQAKRVAAALISRIWRLIHEQRRANQASVARTAEHNALVPVDRIKEVSLKAWGETTTKTARSTVSDSLSRAAADGIGLHRQAGGAGQLRLK